MSFIAIPRAEIGPDVVNVDDVALIPSFLLREEYDRWQELASTRDESAKQAKHLAEFFLDEAETALQIGALAAVAAVRQITVPQQEQLLTSLSARHAFMKLMGSIATATTTYHDKTDTYQDTPQDKDLVDYEAEALTRGAYSLIVHKSRLQRTPFVGNVPDTAGDGGWYVDEDLGLYLNAQSPALASKRLLANLTRATGDKDKTEAILDAENSVNIRPYMSLRYLQSAGGN
ncbi:MAG TPA: hypothetical protein VLF91_03050 [Candidatus Saccharimonadales bacterium]|nr:hypothetical protein [Candidatus Saccharimonadales bacterium]